jgi:hypothetical protein
MIIGAFLADEPSAQAARTIAEALQHKTEAIEEVLTVSQLSNKASLVSHQHQIFARSNPKIRALASLPTTGNFARGVKRCRNAKIKLNMNIVGRRKGRMLIGLRVVLPMSKSSGNAVVDILAGNNV